MSAKAEETASTPSMNSKRSAESISPKSKKVKTEEEPAFSASTIVKYGLLKCLPVETPDKAYKDICCACYRAGRQRHIVDGEDVLSCSFCFEVYHPTAQCLGKCFPHTDYEMQWSNGEVEWACPNCYEEAEEAYRKMLYCQKAIPKILREGNGGVTRKSADQFVFCIISSKRPKNVQTMHDFFIGTGIYPTWIVGSGEKQSYLDQGAKEVVEGGKLCESRNCAIDLAKKQGKVCVEMSDDLEYMNLSIADLDLKFWEKGTGWPKLTQDDANSNAGKAECCKINPVEAARFAEAVMRWQGAKLSGAYPNCNEGFAHRMGPTSSEHFIVGDFVIFDPTASAVRFDERMTLKEDYDFAAANISAHGRVCRVNRLFVKATHYTNEGGAVAVRSVKKEQANIRHLRCKWPGVFVDQRRKNEVIMRWEYHRPDEKTDPGSRCGA